MFGNAIHSIAYVLAAGICVVLLLLTYVWFYWLYALHVYVLVELEGGVVKLVLLSGLSPLWLVAATASWKLAREVYDAVRVTCKSV